MDHKKVKDAHKEMFEIVNRSKELPYDIHLYDGKILSFVYNNIRYYEGNDEETVQYILDRFGISV